MKRLILLSLAFLAYGPLVAMGRLGLPPGRTIAAPQSSIDITDMLDHRGGLEVPNYDLNSLAVDIPVPGRIVYHDSSALPVTVVRAYSGTRYASYQPQGAGPLVAVQTLPKSDVEAMPGAANIILAFVGPTQASDLRGIAQLVYVSLVGQAE